MGANMVRQHSVDELVQEKRHSVDWNNEDSMHHKSAINCLHNYALGKMHIVDLKPETKSKKPTTKRLMKAVRKHLCNVWSGSHTTTNIPSRKRTSISFAADLEQIFEIRSLGADEHLKDAGIETDDEVHQNQPKSLGDTGVMSTSRSNHFCSDGSDLMLADNKPAQTKTESSCFPFPEIMTDSLPDPSHFPQIQ
jgi:hypothetical protein